MQPRLALAVVAALVSFLSSANAQNCNYVTLVKCMIEVLDEFSFTLYVLNTNVVTIDGEQCQHIRQLSKCIDDDGPEQHQCSHDEIVQASNTVSDLLTHRKNAGSFLKSYYLLTYACSPEGQEMLKDHRACLSRERIGEMTLSAGTYLTERFLEHSDDQACYEVNKRLNEYMLAMSDLCQAEAATIMCKSLVGMFRGLHADKLSDCPFDCLRPAATTALPMEEQEISEGQADTLNASIAGRCLASSVLVVLGAALLAR